LSRQSARTRRRSTCSILSGHGSCPKEPPQHRFICVPASTRSHSTTWSLLTYLGNIRLGALTLSQWRWRLHGEEQRWVT